MPRPTPLLATGLVSSLLLAAAPSPAQEAEEPARAWWPAVEIGGWVDERLRLDQLLGRAPSHGYLLRSTSSTLAAPAGAPRLVPVLPELRVVHNSGIPFSLNEGGMHAGRGRNLLLRGGARVEVGRFSASLVPVLVHEANRDFQTIVYGGPAARSPFASPWHWGFQSADLPLRFGSRPRLRVGVGESQASLRLGGVRAGVSSESQWWGPGIRNALVMSDNAGGFPHVFAATDRPWRTPAGRIEARWIVGRLSDSEFFSAEGRSSRSLAGVAATLQPRFEPGLTLGVARVVYGPAGGPERALDVFRNTGHPNVILWDSVPPPEAFGGRDQIFSLFGRWVLPESGVEVYGEWARTDPPASLRDLATDPQRSRGYTLGLQWARPVEGSLLRVQAEATTLEQTPRQGRRVASFYTSRAVPAGYTHRGQVIGAAIGPGASSQWLAGDYIRPSWRLGVLAARIRWENDMFYARAIQPSFHAHDVTVIVGVRGGVTLGGVEVGAETTLGRRYNYLFQNQASSFVELNEMDVSNRTMRLTLAPAPRRRPAPPPPAPPPPPPPPPTAEPEVPPTPLPGLP